MSRVPIAERSVPFVHALAGFGERVALFVNGASVSYAQLAEAVVARAAELGPGRKLVLVAGANDLEPLVTYLACLHAGHPVLLAPGDDPEALDGWAATYDVDVVFANDGSEWTTDARHETPAHSLHPDLALLLTTSGSTGSAKLVRLSHRNLQANAESITSYLGIRETDRAATTLPMHYCYGLSVIHSHLLAGAALILTARSVVDRIFWKAFRELRGTTFPAVPFTFDLLERVGFEAMELPHFRYVTQAGGRLAPERVRHYAELGSRKGWQLVVMYGQTEATARMAYLPPEHAASHPASIGIAIPGGSLEIEPIAGFPDGHGELVYRGPNVMLGYAEGAEDLALGATVEALHTGDVARRMSDGMFEVVGRRSRFTKLFGLRVDLDEIERLLAADGVRALCAGDDEHLVAAIADGHDRDLARDVRHLIHERVGLPAGSVRVVTFEDLPRLPSGKPNYALVLDRGRAPEEGVAPAEAIALSESGPPDDHRRKVRELFAEILDRPDVDDHSTFVSLGGDSLSYVEMSIALEDLLGHLPENWHTRPIHRLVPRARKRPALSRMETNVVLRALGILLVVGTHTGVFYLKGGAHVLLAIAGYNFARFQLNAVLDRDRVTPLGASVLRVAVPSVIWIALATATTDAYGLSNVLLVSGHFGPPTWAPSWHYWFIEALVQILAAMGLFLAVPSVRRVARRHAFGTGVAVLLGGLALRAHAVALGGDVRRIHSPESVLWIFAVGWVAQAARSTTQKLAVSGLVALSVPGFSTSSERDFVILVGILLLVWVPSLGVPRLVSRAAGSVASASLYIYLTHWQISLVLSDDLHPLGLMAVSVAVGLAVSAAAQRATGRVSTLARGFPRWKPGREEAKGGNHSAPMTPKPVTSATARGGSVVARVPMAPSITHPYSSAATSVRVEVPGAASGSRQKPTPTTRPGPSVSS